ncbi:unnamed protein product [Clonostachys rhizophaga]|uniref:Uncharacterized protein n=1 Tax=Clonostachys rhizophaga TaxID=160324 RepID=A0A9N9YKN6_9HYPO|nr:unnamed protein product [Clonostachys rhizophaga]
MSTTFVTAGFDVSCTKGGQDYDMNLKTGANATIGSLLISSNSIYEPGVITVMTTYKADSADNGKLVNSQVRVYKSAELAIMGSGLMAHTYRNFTDDELGSKSMRWIDPTPAILDAVREVTFRTAVAFSDPSSQQIVQGSQLRTTTKYKINMKFFGGTLAITLFSTLAVVILFHGFWRLGRPVSMSPLEIATAFQAPITKGAVSMASDADDIAKQIGRREVRYRDVYLPDGTQSRAITSNESTA